MSKKSTKWFNKEVSRLWQDTFRTAYGNPDNRTCVVESAADAADEAVKRFRKAAGPDAGLEDIVARMPRSRSQIK